MKKIAFIVQRYGIEVNGGAEYYCRVLAERLTGTYEVEVLTSCALEYVTWANWYPAAITTINGVKVNRFPTEYERQAKDHLQYETERKIKKWSRPEEWHGLGWLRMWGRALVGKTVRRYSLLWAQHQGPYTPDLITYLERNHRQYDALIFITYLYYPTIAGLNIAPKSRFLFQQLTTKRPFTCLYSSGYSTSPGNFISHISRKALRSKTVSERSHL
ncbi:hypothetical protein GO730_22375 [Spirosoma sp. HMF3257]|uniref:Glycosyltransferase family 4 protein n=1 Tax=Spirosoma telluris TaxID=2183553 RepID=A0A327NQD7_9BACT|nr:hypothetical protein [Spirosoma telluris]RAI76226.1 hypothetical protein HMF3257_22320 [Spirosoma telluris]